MRQGLFIAYKKEDELLVNRRNLMKLSFKLFLIISCLSIDCFGLNSQCLDLFNDRSSQFFSNLFGDLKHNFISDENLKTQISERQLNAKYSNDLVSRTDPDFWTSSSFSLEIGLRSSFKQIHLGFRKWYDLQFPLYAVKWSKAEDYTRTYVKNVTNSVRQAFIPFFLSKNLSLNGFKRMLQKQNELLILGDDPEKPYGGFGGSGWEASLRKTMDNMGPELTSAERNQIVEDERNNVIMSAGRFRDAPVEIEMKDYIRNYALRKVFENLAEPQLMIKNLPPEAAPKNDFKTKQDSWPHEYPDPQYIGLYLKNMHAIYLKIVNCTGCSRLQIIDLLAEYYQVGINAHLFARGNHSLLMAQVNTILLSIGLNGLKHSSQYPLNLRMDAAALIMNPDRFKDFFRQEVIAHHYFYKIKD